MEFHLVQEFIVLFEMACVVVLFSYLFTRSRIFLEILENRAGITTQVTLAGVFGLLSVFGMSSGIAFDGAVANIRDLGPVIAGLACGPFVGLGAGIIGGAYRLSMGGANVYAVALGPVIAGAAGGLAFHFNRQALVSTRVAIAVTFAIESLVSAFALLVRFLAGDSFATIGTVLINVALPMIIMTTLAAGVFTHISHNLLQERRLHRENQQLAIERESRKNLGTIINTIADPVFVKDRNHRLTLVNEGFCALFGKSAGEIVGLTEYDFFKKPLADRFRREAEDVFLTGTGSENESAVLGADGQEHTIITKMSLYHDASQNPFLVGIIRDISDRKKFEDALRESEERYRTVFETTGTSTILFEENTTILLVNAEFERLSGYKKEEIEGKMSWAGFIFPDDRDRVLSQYPLIREQKDRAARHYEFRFRTRLGEIRTLDLFLSAIPGTNRYVASMVDVTDILRSQKILELVNKKINLLSSITRHDILNQLMVLKGYLSLSITMVENPVLLDYIHRELAAAQTIEHQIKFTRDYENMGVRAPDWQNVNGALLRAKVALGNRKVTVEIDPRDPEVFADPLFEKVLYNLTDNAIRYGGEHMTLVRVTSQLSDQGLVILFEDNGTGIPAQDKKNLFRRGFGKNTGFGLFLSQEILSITGIGITESGIYGKGARFEITVPKGVYRLKNP
jgi:PAS domain S-box-containing protein